MSALREARNGLESMARLLAVEAAHPRRTPDDALLIKAASVHLVSAVRALDMLSGHRPIDLTVDPQELPPPAKPGSGNGGGKRPYSQPKLSYLGTVAELTGAVGGSVTPPHRHRP